MVGDRKDMSNRWCRMSEFDRPGFALPPVAARVGPFSRGDLLEVVWEHHAEPTEELLVVEHGAGLIPFSCVERRWTMAGSADLVDYRTPLGADFDPLVAEAVRAVGPGVDFSFDSLPAVAADVLADGLSAAGVGHTIRQHTVAAVLELPDTFDAYLMSMGKKDRHELRRKRRRYEAAIGEARFVHHTGTGTVFDDFVRFHRMAAGDKGGFMTDAMEAYFADLAGLEGWGIDALVGHDGHVTAAAFGYGDADGYYLYNSSYNPELAEASPGVVLLGRLIELSIERGRRVFDFLKGDEPYKFRLGAEPRALFEVVGRT